MSMSALLSALRGAGRRQVSASTIAARQKTSSHVLRIEGYTQLRKTVANGEQIGSGMFNVGGHDWRLSFYPNGYDKQGTDDKANEGTHIAVFLRHASHERTGDATAKADVSILDQAMQPCFLQDLPEFRFSPTTSLGWGETEFVKHEDLDKEKHLKDDCLTIMCDVTVTEPPRADDHVEVPSPESKVVTERTPPPFKFPGQLTEAIWNIKNVDVKIEVSGETFPAHRWVLETQSPVFKADLSLASATTDNTAVLRVQDMDAEVFKALLRFIYTDSPPQTSLLEEATMAQKLLVAADRYKLQKLKLICMERLCRQIHMNSVVSTLAFAEKHHYSVLEVACVKFLTSPGNLEAFMNMGGLEQIKTGCCPNAVMQLLVKKMIEREEQKDNSTG